jgi:HAD superfamily hydrolase (TIGR01509 family)
LGYAKGTLVLFDLDQTLVDALPLYDRACRRVFLEHFGVECSAYDLDFAGRTLPAIIWEGCKKCGIPRREYDAKAHLLVRDLIRYFDSYVSAPGAQVRVLAGARELLEALSKKGILLGVVTGSAQRSANMLLFRAKLRRHFAFVVGGERAADKKQAARQALLDAKKTLGRFPKKVVLVGDSPREAQVAAAEKFGFIGTATGYHTQKQLSAAGAKAVFADLSGTKKVLAAIMKQLE